MKNKNLTTRSLAWSRHSPKYLGKKGHSALLSIVSILFFLFLWAMHASVTERGLIGEESTADSARLDPDFQLAYEQSFGYFDDIPTQHWLRLQHVHAEAFPNQNEKDLLRHSSSIDDKGKYGKLKSSKNWNAQNFQEEIHCLHAQRLPTDSGPDGPKWVCDPHRLKQTDKRPNTPCLVYSIGSNGNVEFEKAIWDNIGSHCEIHTFDMVTYNKRNGDFAKNLEGYATFHSWGLGTAKQAEDYSKTKRGPPYKTLEQTMQELGHINRTIDIFKIDCEWCEWYTFRDWIRAPGRLRQILVETHNAPMPNARDFFYELHDAGYVIFSKEGNLVNGGGGVEFGFIQLRSDFFIKGTTYKERGLWTAEDAIKI